LSFLPEDWGLPDVLVSRSSELKAVFDGAQFRLLELDSESSSSKSPIEGGKSAW